MDDQQTRNPAQPDSPRRPYVAPAVEDTGEFETLALACGKTLGTYECQLGGGYSAS